MYIKREIRDGVCILSMNKPEVHNAFDDEATEQAIEAFRWARASTEFKVVLLRGEGRSFCTGRDVRAMGERKEGLSHYDFLRGGQEAIKALLEIGKPTIAAMKGAAVGGGAEWGLIADLRVAATDLKFALPEVKYALAVDQGGSYLATSLIGPSRTKWLLMSGDFIDAKTAYEWGLVDFLVSPEELDAKAFEMAAKIAKNPHKAVVSAKELVDELWSDGVRAAIRRECNNQLMLYGTDDFNALREARRSQRGGKPSA